MAKTMAEQYIISIIPQLDREKFNKERRKVDRQIRYTINTEKKKLDLKAKEDKILANQNAKLGKSAKNIANMASGANLFSKVIGSTGGKIAAVLAVIKLIYDTMKKIINASTDFSNNMITASSAFVNKDTRSIMARFGVGSQTATGISKVTGLMGISAEDMPQMTTGQMKLFADLMKQWQAGMNSISKTDMKKFNDVWQGFQKSLASAKLEMQIELQKMLIELAPEIEDVLGSFINMIRSFTKFITSPVVKTLIKILSFVLEFIMDFLSLAADMLGNFNFASPTTLASNTSNYYTYNNTIDASSINSFTGDQNSMYGLATSTQQTNVNYITSTMNRNGKV